MDGSAPLAPDASAETRLEHLNREKQKYQALRKNIKPGWEVGRIYTRTPSGQKREAGEQADSDDSSNEQPSSHKKQKKRKTGIGTENAKVEEVIGVGSLSKVPVKVKTKPKQPKIVAVTVAPASKKRNSHKTPSASFLAQYGPQNVSDLPREKKLITREDVQMPPLMESKVNKTSEMMTAKMTPVQSLSLDVWYAKYCNTKTRSLDEVVAGVTTSLSNKIDADIKKEMNGKKKAPTKATRLLEQKDLEKAEFYKEDEDSSPFQLKSPEEYAFFIEIMDEWLEKEKIRGPIRDRAALGEIDPEGKEFDNLEVCSAQYCSEFMREARKEPEFKERPCQRGDKCVSMMMSPYFPDTLQDGSTDDRFICREFLLPSQNEAVQRGEKLPKHKQLCFFDTIAKITMIHEFYLHKNISCKEVVQNFRNPEGLPMGYPSIALIYPTPKNKKRTGIVRPIRHFTMKGYRQGITNIPGYRTPLRCWKDDLSMEGFCLASTRNTANPSSA
jgi:hypothetical protein